MMYGFATMKLFLTRVVAPVMLVLVGCAAKVQVGQYSLFAGQWEADSDRVKQRASFELKCPVKDLQLTVLSMHPNADGNAGSIGVDGCGHRMVYVRSHSGWVLNSKGDDAK